MSMDDWREQFLPTPEEPEKVEEEVVVEDSLRADVMGEQEIQTTEGFPAEAWNDFVEDSDKPQGSIGDVVENQQRIMMAIDQMAAGFSNQIMILARRIDNFERILEQAQGQPPMTNLMFDAPEVFDKVVNRDGDDSGPSRAAEAKVPEPDLEVPSEVDHLINFQPDFPVSIKVQAAFYMWKEKHGTFQDFVKVAGGPVAAKEARNHLE
jgi:hypothetical protein